MKISNLFKKKSNSIADNKAVIETLNNDHLKSVIGGVGVNTSRSNIKNQGIVGPDGTGTTDPSKDGTGDILTP